MFKFIFVQQTMDMGMPGNEALQNCKLDRKNDEKPVDLGLVYFRTNPDYGIQRQL